VAHPHRSRALPDGCPGPTEMFVPGQAARPGVPFLATFMRSTTMERRVVVSADPPNYESRLDQVAGWITPRDLHFVRSQNKAPEIDPETYRLRIEGDAVAQPLDLSLADLKRLPSRSQVNWLECAGNSRVQF